MLGADEAADLIEAIAARQDKTAFAALFRHFAPRVKAFVMRGGADAEAAQEVVQEAMVLVWRKAASFDRSRARAAFTSAVDVYASLGAAADVARLQARFRAHGIRRGPHAKHQQARSGWDSLTPTETKIAAFVEEGLSNPEIAARLLLSRRTVATHVSHILRKLDTPNIAGVVRYAIRQGLIKV